MVRWALAGCLAVALALAMVFATSGEPPLSLIQPGADSRTAPVIAEDFPSIELPAGPGLDGSIYYVMARDPFHPNETARTLENPRYRMQRPLLSWGAWLLHPTGGGPGLVLALTATVMVGLFCGGVATGSLSRTLGGPAWLAALFPLLPGAWWCLRASTSDALALGLALAAIALSARGRQWPAITFGVLAVLAKEPAILLLAGWAIHRRNRRDLLLVLVPGLVAASWMGWLHLVLPADTARQSDLGAPFVGLVDAWRAQWSQGRQLLGMASTLGGYAVGITALALRRLHHPLGWAIALQLAFLSLMGESPAAMDFGGTRMAMPVLVLGLIALCTPDGARELRSEGAKPAPPRRTEVVPLGSASAAG